MCCLLLLIVFVVVVFHPPSFLRVEDNNFYSHIFVSFRRGVLPEKKETQNFPHLESLDFLEKFRFFIAIFGRNFPPEEKKVFEKK